MPLVDEVIACHLGRQFHAGSYLLDTATIAGTVTKGGLYAVVITATNAVSKVTQTFSLTMDQPPSMTSAAKASATVGTAFSFTVTTAGYPYPAISGTGLLAGLTLLDNANGTATISGTPASGSAGVYNIAIRPSVASGQPARCSS